jgi:hypothetical protein
VDIPQFLGSCPSRLLAISHQPLTFLSGISGLSCNGSWSSLYSLGMDCTESIASNSSSIVTSCSCCTDHVENTTSQIVHWHMLGICYLAKGIVYGVSNGSTCPIHFIFHYLNIIIFDEACKLWSLYSCSFLQPPTVISLLNANTLLNTIFFP